VTKKAVHALPTIESLFEAVGRSNPKNLNVLDMKSAYCTLPVAKKDQTKTALVVDHGFLNFLKLPFPEPGPKTSSSSKRGKYRRR